MKYEYYLQVDVFGLEHPMKRDTETGEISEVMNIGNYDVDEKGTVVNTKTGRTLHLYDDKNGYKVVTLSIGGKQKRVRVHRLVALKYIPNPNELPQVNHIDGNKQNNSVENLEWCDSSQNQRHRRYVLKTGNRAVRRAEDGKTYEMIKAAAEDNDSYIPNIVRACKTGSTAKGYHWEYI